MEKVPSLSTRQEIETGRSPGRIEAAGIREAAAKLREQGLFISSLQPVGESSKTAEKKKRGGVLGGKVALRDLLLFTRQFAVLVRAGVNLSACLKIMEDQAENPVLGEVIAGIRRDVETGNPLYSLWNGSQGFPSLCPHGGGGKPAGNWRQSWNVWPSILNANLC